MNIHEENSTYRFRVQSEREQTLVDSVYCVHKLDVCEYMNA